MKKITPNQHQITNWSLVVLLSLLMFGCLEKRGVNEKPATILEQVDVAPVWSVHRAGPPELLTRDGRQYVAYFDHDRFLSLAQRELDSNQWNFYRFPVQMGWQSGNHAKLSLAMDRQGYIHITAYRRNLLQEPPLPPRPIYYRSVAPHSINEFERLYMVSENERTDYPTFITVDGTMYFSFRDGGSGKGDQFFYRYDDDKRQWAEVLDTPLIDGQEERSAYIYGNGLPIPGPDGHWHLLWVWRETPDHATNHSLSYARTIGSDLTQWESAGGVPVTLPFTLDNTELVVDDAPPGGGLSNPLNALSWDSRDRAVISYHRFDENGASQIYNARFVDKKWMVVPATRWDFVWGDSYSGTGAINISGNVRMSPVKPSGKGEMTQFVWNREVEEANVVIDEKSLQPIREESPKPIAWRQKLLTPESDFQIAPNPDLRRTGGPMQVVLIPGSNRSDVNGDSWFLRWEHGGSNRDRPVPEPWPQPTMLRVYKIGNTK